VDDNSQRARGARIWIWKPLAEYPTIFIVGWVKREYGIWRSDDNARSWIKIGDFPLGSLDEVTAMDGDKKCTGRFISDLTARVTRTEHCQMRNKFGDQMMLCLAAAASVCLKNCGS